MSDHPHEHLGEDPLPWRSTLRPESVAWLSALILVLLLVVVRATFHVGFWN